MTQRPFGWGGRSSNIHVSRAALTAVAAALLGVACGGSSASPLPTGDGAQVDAGGGDATGEPPVIEGHGQLPPDGGADAGADADVEGNGDAAADGAAPTECTAGLKQCAGLVPKTCSTAGRWTSGAACPFVCREGACIGTCTPGAAQCAGKTTQTCNAAGDWVGGATCANACVNGACTGTCSPGAKQCSGLAPQACSAAGQWQAAGAACPFQCTAGACTGECVPGTKACDAGGSKTCGANARWGAASTCPFVCVASSGTCGGVCAPGATRCSGAAAQRCDATGQWQTSQTCPFVCTGNGVCGGSCAPTTVRCNANAPQTCDSAGSWVTESGTCTSQCTVTGRYRVTGNIVYDTYAGIDWDRIPVNGTLSSASSQCRQRGAGFDLPDDLAMARLRGDQLGSVPSTCRPHLDQGAFPSTPNGYFWINARSETNPDPNYVTTYNFTTDSYVDVDITTGATAYAYCVRSHP